MGKRSEINYLDYVPTKNPELEWQKNKDDLVFVTVKWRGFYHRLAQKLFKKPESSQIALDEYGSFVWEQIDGALTVFELSELVEEQFGEKAKPVMERLIKFIEILKDHKFVTLEEKQNA